MELAVQGAHGLQFTLPPQTIDAIHQFRKLAKVGPAGVLAAQCRGQALEHLADLVGLDQDLRVQAADKHPQVVHRLDQPAKLQLQQRLADDTLGHAEASGQLLLDQPLAGPVPAGEDQSLDAFADAVSGQGGGAGGFATRGLRTGHERCSIDSHR